MPHTFNGPLVCFSAEKIITKWQDFPKCYTKSTSNVWNTHCHIDKGPIGLKLEVPMYHLDSSPTILRYLTSNAGRSWRREGEGSVCMCCVCSCIRHAPLTYAHAWVSQLNLSVTGEGVWQHLFSCVGFFYCRKPGMIGWWGRMLILIFWGLQIL